MNQEDIKNNLKNKNSWLRAFYIMLFVLFYSLAEIVLMAAVLFQVAVNILTGKVNEKVLSFSRVLTKYIYDVLKYITFQNDERPFPFAEWPSSEQL